MEQLSTPVRFFSHSRTEADEVCRYKRYLSREWGGTGLTPVTDSWDLLYGNLIHSQLDNLAKEGSIDYLAARKLIIEEAVKVMDQHAAADWGAIGEGMLRGFVKQVWPLWMAEYTVYQSERKMEYEAAPSFVYRWIDDLLLRSKYDGHIRKVDYKTTSSDKPEWIASWSKSTQMHGAMHALKAAQGIEVRDCVVLGLYKGYKDKKLKVQKSPFSYGWVNRQFSLTPQYSYEYQRSKGWESFSVAAEFEDCQEWVESMPTEILSQQFPQTGPIAPRTDISETWFRQQLIREREVDHAVQSLRSCDTIESIQAVLDQYFRKNYSKCQPAWGYACEFKDLCWIPGNEADPLGSGLFQRYDPESVGE